MRSVTGHIGEIFEEILSKHELMNFRFANYRLKNIHIFSLEMSETEVIKRHLEGKTTAPPSYDIVMLSTLLGNGNPAPFSRLNAAYCNKSTISQNPFPLY